MPNSGQEETGIEFARITERGRSVRWALVSFAIVAVVWIVTDAVVRIASLDRPAWLTLALAILAPAGLGAAPGIIALRWVRRFIRNYTNKRKELEEKIDKNRSSSNLRKDGSLPHD